MCAKKLKVQILCVTENIFLKSHILIPRLHAPVVYTLNLYFSILAISDYSYITYWNKTHFIIYIMNNDNEKVNLKKNCNTDFWFPGWQVRSLASFTPFHTQGKSWINWKQTTLLRSIRELRSQRELRTPKPDRHRKSQLTGAETHDEELPGIQDQGSKALTLSDELLEEECTRVWELRTPGGPLFVSPPGTLLDTQSEEQRNNPLCFSKEREK